MAHNGATYADCVASLRSSLDFLSSSVAALDAGVSDLPRLASVLRPTRHFELIPQPTLAAAEASLRDEIGPQIALLLDRADAQIARRERRIETLQARCELLQGRLARPEADDDEADDNNNNGGGGAAARKYKNGRGDAKRKPLGGERALRARAVRQRREGLEYSVERLELEVLTKERELRKRLDKA
ncbi:DASH complex subunit SPC19 [Colletotrichum tanaceti]|uniref:DASH complex subunit SPC19 n=1 Tax=Colletotrichum tanaceti TaxID=1306861 RepID=A0A4U6X646_9PEZI|nr:DASH complex subunit SPC19 [Colletotrichum tanaceti]